MSQQYGELQIDNSNPPKVVPPYPSIVASRIKGTKDAPELWATFSDGSEKQIAGDGMGLLTNYNYGQTIVIWNGAANETVTCPGYLYTYPMAFGGRYKFNRMRFKRRSVGAASEAVAVVYNSAGTVKLFQGTTKVLGVNANSEYVVLEMPEINETNCGQTPRIGLAFNNAGARCLGYLYAEADAIPLVLNLAGDLANIPNDLQSVGIAAPAALPQPYFELYFEE